MPSPARLWYFITPTQSIIWALSFASSQLDSVTTETWLILSSCSLGLLILALALFLRRWPGSDLLWPWGSAWHNEGIGWKLYGGTIGVWRRAGGRNLEASQPPRPGSVGSSEHFSRGDCVVLCFWQAWLAGPVVIIKDPFDGGRPRSKQSCGKDTVGIYNVRVTFLIRLSETCWRILMWEAFPLRLEVQYKQLRLKLRNGRLWGL